MSSDHRKPVVAFVVLALAAALVIGVQQADADGGRLLAAPAGVGAHVQGSIASPTETLSSRDFDRLADLGPAFASLRELVGHADARTVAQDTDQGGGTEPAVAGAAASPAVSTRTGPGVTTRTSPRERTSGKSAPARSTSGSKAPARKPGKAASEPASQKNAGPTGKASTPLLARSSAQSSGKASGKASSTSSAKASAKARGKSSSKARKATLRVHSRTSATVQTTATSWRPGKSYRSVKKASPRSVATHRSARPGRRPARVAATSRATGVPASAWHHGKAHGKAHGKR